MKPTGATIGKISGFKGCGYAIEDKKRIGESGSEFIVSKK
jgi:hypothetical protein